MKTISQKELDRLRRKKGVDVKRKMGAQTRPGPEDESEESLSGENLKDASESAPAASSTDLTLSKMSEILERLALAKMTDLLTRLVPGDEVPPAAKPEPAPMQAPTYTPPKPYVVKKSAHLRPFQIMKNTGMPKASAALVPSSPVPSDPIKLKRKSIWTHTVDRDESGYLKQVVSIDGSGAKWTHEIVRSASMLIKEVLSKAS